MATPPRVRSFTDYSQRYEHYLSPIGRQLSLIKRDFPLIWAQVAALEKTIDSRNLDIQILERRVSLFFFAS